MKTRFDSILCNSFVIPIIILYSNIPPSQNLSCPTALLSDQGRHSSPSSQCRKGGKLTERGAPVFLPNPTPSGHLPLCRNQLSRKSTLFSLCSLLLKPPGHLSIPSVTSHEYFFSHEPAQSTARERELQVPCSRRVWSIGTTDLSMAVFTECV